MMRRTDWLLRLGKAAGSVIALGASVTGAPAQDARCGRMQHGGQGYVVCTVASNDVGNLNLWLNGPDGTALGTFDKVRGTLPAGRTLVFAMNAGMYHADRSPVGLFVADGQQYAPLVTGAGAGNFGMVPNGVFCADGARPYQVIETRAFDRTRPDCRIATQSGPMLVLDGALHPRFLPDATSRHVRNGVGVDADGQTAWFVISDRPVTFHEFARAFRDGLGARDALYFDGSISRLYAPALGRADMGRAMGPIVGLTAN